MTIGVPKLGEEVQYTVTGSPGESITFKVVEPEAASAERLVVAFTHERPGQPRREGAVEFNQNTGRPARISIGDPFLDYGVRAQFYADPWFLFRYVALNRFEHSAYYLNDEGYSAPVDPIMSFLAWGLEIDPGIGVTRDAFGYQVNISATAPRGADSFEIHIGLPQYDGIGGLYRDRPRTLRFAAGSGFPIAVLGERADEREPSLSGTWLANGSKPIDWRWISTAESGQGCGMATGRFDRAPAEGSRERLPFPLSIALDAVRSSPSYAGYVQSHPDHYFFSGTYLNETLSSPPRQTWILRLGHPNPSVQPGQKFAGYEVWKLGLGAASQVVVANEFDGILDPLPNHERVRIDVPTLSAVYDELKTGSGVVELGFRIRMLPSELRVVEVDGFIHDGSDSPLEYHYGKGGCVLELGRYKPAPID